MEDTSITRLAAELADSDQVEDAIELLGRIEQFTKLAKELRAMGEEAVLDFIRRNGDFEFGNIRYYAGDTKRTKPRDLKVLSEEIIVATGGDIHAFAEYLSSNPFKTGPCRKLFGEDFDKFFETKVVPKLKEGKPVKRLISADKRYLDA